MTTATITANVVSKARPADHRFGVYDLGVNVFFVDGDGRDCHHDRIGSVVVPGCCYRKE
jgi:hypothetical protein